MQSEALRCNDLRFVFRKEADVGDVAILLRIVHAVTDHEAVGDAEADVIGFNRHKAALRFVEAGGNLERCGLVLQEETAQVAECQAGVENVFDHDDVFALDGDIEILDELDGSAGGLASAVGRNRNKIKGVVDLDGACKVGEEDRSALEHAHEHNAFPPIVVADLFADGFDAFGNLVGAEENFAFGCGHGGQGHAL